MKNLPSQLVQPMSVPGLPTPATGRICIYLLQGAVGRAESQRRGCRYCDAIVQRAEERRQSGRWGRILHEHIRDVSVRVCLHVCVCACVRVCMCGV